MGWINIGDLRKSGRWGIQATPMIPKTSKSYVTVAIGCVLYPPAYIKITISETCSW